MRGVTLGKAGTTRGVLKRFCFLSSELMHALRAGCFARSEVDRAEQAPSYVISPRASSPYSAGPTSAEAPTTSSMNRPPAMRMPKYHLGTNNALFRRVIAQVPSISMFPYLQCSSSSSTENDREEDERFFAN
ncbi:hypothetical protein EXIGLDRAFT_59137 [Exidia glandulosa HHB12029]|uniref:Uncharacterized protein n=1 Tax=Exidia glandulosa HHB12029 TaxID=1314781 RepID=A0A165I5A6_EXIGL|nr:hypothetical protein EXIGLDRAFT_59137 [Exidia glandulosa HHB12029]